VDSANARIARILDTKHLEWFLASEPLLEALQRDSNEIVEPLHPIAFDADGMFADQLPA
jgi:hypothetical protein